MDASSSRPSIVELAVAQQRRAPRRPAAPGAGVSSSGSTRSVRLIGSGLTAQRAAVVAVLPRADVPGRVERQTAQRAGRPAGGDHPAGALDEGAGVGRLDPHPQRVGPVLDVLEQGLLRRSASSAGAWASMTTSPASPSQARPIAPTRNSSSIGCSSGVDVGSPAGQRGAGAGDDLVEQLLEPVGEHGDLLLLQRDGHHPGAVGGLQVEGAVAGRADGAGDEAAGRSKRRN